MLLCSARIPGLLQGGGVDEIGHFPISRTGAIIFFQLMTRRYEHASTVLTSNKGFEEWGAIFGHEGTAAALIDRLVHHWHIVTIRGNSYACASTRSSGGRSTPRPIPTLARLAQRRTRV